MEKSIKEQVLEQLESGRLQGRNWLSGEALAAQLKVSRAAVWKAVQSLAAEGCPLEAVPRRGYRLSAQRDLLFAAGIRRAAAAVSDDAARALSLQVFRSVSSTNTLIREAAAQGAPEGLVILAGNQTAGRGRLGRSFFSPEDSGLYMSLLLRPTMEAGQAVLLTTAAAVAVCDGIEAATGFEPRIKWVNDVFLNGKKICGILTEAAFGTENGRLEYAVPGIGVNVYEPEGGFPAELAAIAGSVCGPAGQGASPALSCGPDVRNRLAGEILARFWDYYRVLDSRSFLESYRRRSLVIGRPVLVVRNTGSRPAKALAIDDSCRLLVRYDDGSEEFLSTGEISIRLPE